MKPSISVPTSAGGFTLVELMITIAVASILLGIAIPSFTNLMRNSQIAAQSGQLMSSLALARSEAVKRGVRVSVCGASIPITSAIPTGVACANTWNNGWLVFTDDFGGLSGAIDASDEILQSWPADSRGVNVAPTAAPVSFSRNGRAELAQSFTVTKSGCGANQRRNIAVTLSGRVTLTKSNCS